MAQGNKKRAEQAIQAARRGNIPGFNLFPTSISIPGADNVQRYILKRIKESGGPEYDSIDDLIEDIRSLGYEAAGSDEFGTTYMKP